MAEPADRPGNVHSTPRWVKVAVVVAIVITALVVGVMALAGGEHGPGQHLPGGGDGPAGHTAPARGHD